MKKYYILIAFLITSLMHSQCYSRLTSGGNHVTGIKTDGTLWGWGRASGGILSNTPPFPGTYEQFPIQMGGADTWLFNKNGRSNSFAIKTNGTLWATGSNTNGILGIGSTSSAILVLTQVGTATNYISVDGYDEHSLALKSDGTIWIWGRNDFNQLGQGTTSADVLSPIQVGTATDWAKISATRGASFAIKTDGTLWCWGFNCGGNLAAGTTITSRPSPFQIGTATDWLFIEPGNCHVLALKTDNTLWAWGNRTSGQLGIPGITALQSQSPKQVGTATWQSIATGYNSSFGVQTNGTLWVWGENTSGELGLNDTTNRDAPTQMGTDTNWVSVIAGEDHTIAIKNDGTLWAWGENYYGATGNGSFDSGTGFFNPILIPTQIPSMCAPLHNERFNLATTISISPNPATNQVNLIFSTALQNPSISIVDITGKTVLTQNHNTILNNTSMNIAGLSKGLYLVVVKSEGNTSVEKLLIN